MYRLADYDFDFFKCFLFVTQSSLISFEKVGTFAFGTFALRYLVSVGVSISDTFLIKLSVSMSQTQILGATLELEIETRIFPALDTARHSTDRLCPSNFFINVNVFKSHTPIVLSSEAEYNILLDAMIR